MVTQRAFEYHSFKCEPSPRGFEMESMLSQLEEKVPGTVIIFFGENLESKLMLGIKINNG